MMIIATIMTIIVHKRPRTIASSFSQYTINIIFTTQHTVFFQQLTRNLVISISLICHVYIYLHRMVYSSHFLDEGKNNSLYHLFPDNYLRRIPYMMIKILTSSDRIVLSDYEK
jgi:hypothetical protein